MNTEELLKKIRSVKLCLMAHPDNEQDSEFADRISDLEEIENQFKAEQPVITNSEVRINGKNMGETLAAEQPVEDKRYTIGEFKTMAWKNYCKTNSSYSNFADWFNKYLPKVEPVEDKGDTKYTEEQMLGFMTELADNIIREGKIGEFTIGGMSVHYPYIKRWFKTVSFKMEHTPVEGKQSAISYDDYVAASEWAKKQEEVEGEQDKMWDEIMEQAVLTGKGINKEKFTISRKQ